MEEINNKSGEELDAIEAEREGDDDAADEDADEEGDEDADGEEGEEGEEGEDGEEKKDETEEEKRFREIMLVNRARQDPDRNPWTGQYWGRLARAPRPEREKYVRKNAY